ncbi:MAG TPA: Ig-like domain-containing protein, partial [Candidatus Dormibacteraeota bacterium]|nr:Ig-like domain-containing protein [Candidatus Dormibacteraeota bacterium]
MTARRPARPAHVRPRPASTGRPRPATPRPRPTTTAHVPIRTTSRRPRQGLPLAAQLLLATALVVLVGAVTLAASGGLSVVVGSLGSAVGKVVGAIGATPKASTTAPTLLEAPTLAAPAQQYTNQAKVTVTGSMPRAFIGAAGYSVRVDDSIEGAAPVAVKELPVPAIAELTIVDVPLAAGRNDLTARLVASDGSMSDPSASVTYILDTQPPALTIISPANGSTVNGDTVKITGRTQPSSSIAARDEANAATATATAGTDGSFAITMPLADGTNGITVTATDPAGNTASTVVGVTKGSGKLTAHLTASPYRISAANGANLTVSVTVTDPNGQPLQGASVQFTITVPGL